MSKPTVRLPDKLWQLLELSINSAKELDPTKYTLDMNVWYIKRVGTPCSVCMAGAVMVYTLGVTGSGHVVPEMFDSNTDDKLVAIDNLRCGNIFTAAEVIRIPSKNFNYGMIDSNVVSQVRKCANAPWRDNWSAHYALLSELKRLDL